jgi:hypothetical protein
MSLYPRLFENLDGIYKGDISCSWMSDRFKPVPFGFYNGITLVGNGDTHAQMLEDNGIIIDDYEKLREHIEYAGRLWKIPKVITFWVYPPESEWKTIIDKLSKAIGENIWSNDWRVEIVTNEKGEKMKPERNSWDAGDKNDEGTVLKTKLIPVPEYSGSEKRSAEEIKQQHVISPLLKKKREVPYGFGSKNPKYQEKRKWQMADIADENKEELPYPKLFEHPDWITKPSGYEIMWDKPGTYAFGMYNGRLFVSRPRATHSGIAITDKNGKHLFTAQRQTFKYAGRIWTKQKIVSFWVYPTKPLLFKILKGLEEKLEITIIDDPAYKIDIPKEGIKKPGYGQKGKQIPIGEYLGNNYKQAPEDLARQHIISPLLKQKREVTPGWGSKNPKYTEHRQWAIADLQHEEKEEELYPKLFENPNAIWNDEKKRKNDWKEKHDIAFSYYNKGKKKMLVSTDTHGDISCENPSMTSLGYSGRGVNSGRIFRDQKIITFWIFPKDYEDLIKTLRDVEKAVKERYAGKLKLNLLTDKKWRIEIPNRGDDEEVKYETLHGNWGSWDPEEGDQKYIPISIYKGGPKRSKKELAQQHVLSPLLKPKREVPYGFGSKNPKYMKNRQWAIADLQHESFYPRIDEAASKKQQLWIDLYKKTIPNPDFVDPKSFEILRANFGPNDGTAETNVKKILDAAGIHSNSYKIVEVPRRTSDEDAKKQISGDFSAYKIKFTGLAHDIFDKDYVKDDFLIFTNRTKVSGKTGESSVIGKKDLTPDNIKLGGNSYPSPDPVLQAVKKYLNEKSWPDNYKKFILESSKFVVTDSKNNNKFNNFFAYIKVSTPVTYNVPLKLFEGIDDISMHNIANDYGEVLGALMFFNILRRYGKGLKYPEVSNEKMIDFFFDDYKISSKAGKGATPGGGAIIKKINDAYESGEISFNEEWEIDFYENLIKPWMEPEELDKSEVYNTVMTLAKLHLNPIKSGYAYLVSEMNAEDKDIKREDIIKFTDDLIKNDKKFDKFIVEFIELSKASFTKPTLDRYKKEYIQKIAHGDNSRIGLIFYPIIVELVKILNKKYANMLTVYTQKVSDIKQVYLEVKVKRGEFIFKTYAFNKSNFVFERKCSVNNPFSSMPGIKMKT